MIYLVGSPMRAERWCHDQTPPVQPREVHLITSLARAQGIRPRPSDRIVALHPLTPDQVAASRRLTHERNLAEGRRTISVRQAP